jgi:hypothetical protein
VKLLATLTDSLDPGFGRIALVDLARERAEIVLEWLPPAELRSSGKGFLGIAWLGDPGKSNLLACAHAALCRIDPATWSVTGLLHQPCMNDLHHATISDDKMLVANSGLDRIDTFDAAGRFIGGFDLAPAWIAAARMGGLNPTRASFDAATCPGWDRAPRSLVDEPLAGSFEQLASPALPFPVRKNRHFVHPNHITMLNGRPLVTRFIDRSIQDLADWSLAVPQTPGHPHDGEVDGDCFWITCTTGLIVGYAIRDGRLTSREVERIDINQCTGRSGWCRGLLVTNDLFVVSVTTIQYMPPFGWSDPDFSKTETSILAIDRRSRKLAARVNFEQFGQLPKLFGMVALPGLKS